MAAQVVKDPYLFDFLGTADLRREQEVEQASAPRALDEAVLAAYGLADNVSEGAILAHRLALNLSAQKGALEQTAHACALCSGNNPGIQRADSAAGNARHSR